MDLGPLRALVFQTNLSAHGVPATVTRPAPDNLPVVTTGIWLTAPQDEPRPYGTDFQRREPRRIFVLPRDVLPTIPRGTQVSAPDKAGGTVLTWQVDGVDRTEADHWRVLLVVVPTY